MHSVFSLAEFVVNAVKGTSHIGLAIQVMWAFLEMDIVLSSAFERVSMGR